MRAVCALAVVVSCVAGCSSNSEYVQKLRTAVNESQVTLAQTIAIAEHDTQGGAGVKARLLVDGDAVFAVGAVEAETLRDFRIDLQGQIRSSDQVGPGIAPCPGAISLSDAVAVAEREAGGEGVAIVPDDDVACAFEVQVLTADTLWEVKVGSDGTVLESEESDEGGSEDD